MVDAKSITMGAVLLAAMAGLAFYYGGKAAVNEDGTPNNKLNWNGKHFTSTVTADDGSVATVWSDMDANSQRMDTTDAEGVTTSFVVLDGQAWDLTFGTMTAGGQSYTFYTQCAKAESGISLWAEDQFTEEAVATAAASVEEEFDEESLTGVTIDIDGQELELKVEDGKITGMKYGEDGAVISGVSFEPIDAAIFALPEVCEGDQSANDEIIAAYIRASKTETRRQLREIEEEENWPEDHRTPSEATIRANRALKEQHQEHNRRMWGAAGDVIASGYTAVKRAIAEEASINMFNNRYAGPEQEGCAPEDRWSGDGKLCGGPVSEVDACTTYHDHGCGAHAHAEGGISQPGTRGASGGANEGHNRNVGCLYGPHHSFERAEHCSCTGTLNKCAWNARGTGCFNGQPDCRPSWTGTKVSVAFAIFPCWYQNKESYQHSCRTRWPGCSCSWRGCRCWGFSRSCQTATRTASHCPMGFTGSAHRFWNDGSKCCSNAAKERFPATGSNAGTQINKGTCDAPSGNNACH